MDGVWSMCEGHQTEAQQRILIKTSLRKQAVQISHQRHQHTTTLLEVHRQHSRLTDPQQASAWEELGGGRDGVKVVRKNVYNRQIPSGWKGLERAANGQVMMGGNKSARDAENRAKKDKVFLSAYSSSWSSWWWILHRSVLTLVLLSFSTSLPRGLPWKVFPKNRGILEITESEPWHQQFLTKTIFKFKPRWTELFKNLFAIHLPHRLHSRLTG